MTGDPDDPTRRLGRAQLPTEHAWSQDPEPDLEPTQYSPQHDREFLDRDVARTPAAYPDPPVADIPWFRRPGVLFTGAAIAAAIALVALYITFQPSDGGGTPVRSTVTQTQTSTSIVEVPVTQGVPNDNGSNGTGSNGTGSNGNGQSTPDVTHCPNGQDVSTGQACPSDKTCPTGTVKSGGQCKTVTECSDGTTVTAPTTCEAPAKCPNGSPPVSGQTCSGTSDVTCPGGSTVPAGQTCAVDPVHCPNGTTVPPGQTCPATNPPPDVKCPDGSTAPTPGDCPPVVRTPAGN